MMYNGGMFYEVIPEGKVEALTYDYDGSLLPGQIVIVPVGRRQVPGVVVKKVAQPDFKTKTILKVLYTKPLPRHLLAVVKFLHEYYLAPSGSAVSLILPTGVEKKRRTKPNETEHMIGNKTSHEGPRPAGPSPWAAGAQSRAAALRKSPSSGCLIASDIRIPLNHAQKNALEGLQKARTATKLLFGVTGSGKTNVYLQEALNAFQGHKSVILLVPEIALTGQVVRVFREVFGDKIVMIHSKQTEAERHLIFERVLEAEEPLIVVGPRSALFAPVRDLGLIIVDEEHESTYYQENTPKYSAIRVASFLASEVGGSCILGSATPTVADYHIAKQRGSLVTLATKAKAEAVKPKIQIIDFKNRDNFTKNRYFSNALLSAVARNLEAGRQTLIFHNRRGSAPLTICESCGEEMLCPNCFLPLTLHADTYELVCHTCGYGCKVPTVCPKCGHPGLVHKGFGTKLLENEISRLFPSARVKRFDADNKKGEGMDALYSTVRDGEVDILIGTQTLAKGLDLPKLATVGVVQADAGLSLPDFAAEEKVFQLLTQVIGRVGRGHIDEAEVFIQTFRPEHPVISYAVTEDYEGFSEYLLAARRRGGFPPYRYVMRLDITLKTESLVLRKVREAVARLVRDKRLVVSPPMPAFHERTSRGYTWQIVVRSTSRKALLEACQGLDKNFRVSLDPPGLL